MPPDASQSPLYNTPAPGPTKKSKKIPIKLVVVLVVALLVASAAYVGFRLVNSSSADVTDSSGLNWPSGLHAANELGPHIQFGNWRGRPIDVLHTFTNRGSWDGVISAQPYLNWHKSFYDDKDHIYVISQPTFAKGGNNAACARGEYNDEWKRFGKTLVDNGLNHHNTVVRIGWEFNGNYMYWHTDADPTNFKACWRNVATAIKSVSPNIRTDWTLNGHGGPVPAGGNMYTAYPGDDVVDIIAMDEYDHWPPARTDADFDSRCNKGGGSGVCDLAKFARQHGKEFAVGEWSVTGSCAGSAKQKQNGGDSALYIRRMAQFFNENRDILAYEAYYDDPIPGNVCSTLFRNNTDGSSNPKAAAEYKKYFGKDSPYANAPPRTRPAPASPQNNNNSNSSSSTSGTSKYNGKLLLAPQDNRIYYIKNGKKSWLHNGALVGCISYRGAGSLVRGVSQTVINNFPNGDDDHCRYETERGLNFVRERSSNNVWLVKAGGTKLLVGAPCVPDAYTTSLKPFRIHVVADGETAGHKKTGSFFGTPGLCGQLPN